MLRRLRESDGVRQVVGKLRGSVEQAQANPVVAVILEDLQTGLGFIVVLENRAAIFRLLQEGKVRADGIVGSAMQAARNR